MSTSFLDVLERCIVTVNCCLALCFNSILIYFILNHSRKHIGTYKYLMLSFAIFNLFYPVVDFVVMPVTHVYEYSIIMFPSFLLQNHMTLGTFGIALFGCSFCQSITLLAYHFIYRYLLLCRPQLMFVFNARRYVPCFVLFWLLMSLVWGATMLACMSHDESFSEYVGAAMRAEYGLDVGRTRVMGFVYRAVDSEGVLRWRVSALLGCGICTLILGAAFAVIGGCTLSISSTLRSSAMSEKSRRLQLDLLRALLVQTLVPLVFEFAPCAAAHFVPLLHWPIGRWCNLATLGVSLYPALDPLCILYFIKDYRYAIVRKIRPSAKVSTLYMETLKSTSKYSDH